MRLKTNLWGLVAVAAGLVGVLATSPASAQNTCDWYAKTAVKQQQDNLQRQCGFSGPSWSIDMKAHLAWCAGASPDQWKAEAQKRDQQLAGCTKK